MADSRFYDVTEFDTVDELLAQIREDRPDEVVIEANAYQGAVIPFLREQGIRVRAIYSEKRGRRTRWTRLPNAKLSTERILSRGEWICD